MTAAHDSSLRRREAERCRGRNRRAGSLANAGVTRLLHKLDPVEAVGLIVVSLAAVSDLPTVRRVQGPAPLVLVVAIDLEVHGNSGGRCVQGLPRQVPA